MLYEFGKIVLGPILRFLGFKVEGAENVPEEGPLLVAGNHASGWDPVLIGLAMNRPVTYMAKVELFNNPFRGFLLKRLYVIPLERNKGDLHAIRTAMKCLQEGKTVGIFPEGRRTTQYDPSKIGGGVGLLAYKSKVQVLPVAVIGSERKLVCGWFHPLKVRFGKPLSFQMEEGQKKNSENFIQFGQEVIQTIYSML